MVTNARFEQTGMFPLATLEVALVVGTNLNMVPTRIGTTIARETAIPVKIPATLQAKARDEATIAKAHTAHIIARMPMMAVTALITKSTCVLAIRTKKQMRCKGSKMRMKIREMEIPMRPTGLKKWTKKST